MAQFRIASSDVATIARDVGAPPGDAGVMMAVTAVIALAFREFFVALGFVLAAFFTGLVGGFLRWELADAKPPRMKHGMIIAALGWFTTAFFGALPFFFSAHIVPPGLYASFVPAGADWDPVSVFGVSSQSSLVYFRHPLHAMFESMSGWTGSGLTMAAHEPSLPRAPSNGGDRSSSTSGASVSSSSPSPSSRVPEAGATRSTGVRPAKRRSIRASSRRFARSGAS